MRYVVLPLMLISLQCHLRAETELTDREYRECIVMLRTLACNLIEESQGPLLDPKFNAETVLKTLDEKQAELKQRAEELRLIGNKI